MTGRYNGDRPTIQRGPMTSPSPVDQRAFWNGAAGRKWTDFQDTLDGTFVPVLRQLLARGAIKSGERVIDIGCGCGASSIELGGMVGPGGEVTGIDISQQMLARAKARTPQGAPVSYLLADATDYAFAPGHTDVLFSRFGVMFFDQPERAFGNLAGALRPGGRLIFACWRAARENPYFILPLQEAYKHVPRLPEIKPEDPGPFAFASEERVRNILQAAGFTSIALEAFDTPLDMAGGRGLDHAVHVALSIGPAGRALEGQPQDKVEAAAASIRAALARHQQGNSLNLPAAIWIVSAVKP
jgi:ubiquinone/menaquinone biosynthesis C-methylase UbiE